MAEGRQAILLGGNSAETRRCEPETADRKVGVMVWDFEHKERVAIVYRQRTLWNPGGVSVRCCRGPDVDPLTCNDGVSSGIESDPSALDGFPAISGEVGWTGR